MTRAGRYTREQAEGTWHVFARLPKALRRPALRAARAAGQPLNLWLANLIQDATFCARKHGPDAARKEGV